MQRIIEVIDSIRALSDIAAYAHPDLPSAFSSLQLSFGEMQFVLSVDPDTDQILVSDDIDTVLLSIDLPLSLSAGLVGKRVRGAWQMRNHQGYYDGMQLEFIGSSEASTVSLQVMAGASMLRFMSVQAWQG